ncbi:hypothetical protein AXF42_Ash016977 [Apostasia shenzhenica]|uniref:Uncharacterized protein n=1 Tax=Apostasia shenzhenica TaxID=1088818 RepID=A0A2I0B7B7_9ASPA|nr:hypothetical protein AXF42_Ash016977 [Apostasia shenzhenica]
MRRIADQLTVCYRPPPENSPAPANRKKEGKASERRFRYRKVGDSRSTRAAWRPSLAAIPEHETEDAVELKKKMVVKEKLSGDGWSSLHMVVKSCWHQRNLKPMPIFGYEVL